MYNARSKQEQQEQEGKEEALKSQAWNNFPLTPEELERLLVLMGGKDWPLLVKCLTGWQEQLSETLFRSKTSWEETLFVRGQRDTLRKILLLPKDFKLFKERMKDGDTTSSNTS